MNKDIGKCLIKLKTLEIELNKVIEDRKNNEDLIEKFRKELHKHQDLNRDLYDKEHKYKREWEKIRDEFVNLSLDKK